MELFRKDIRLSENIYDSAYRKSDEDIFMLFKQLLNSYMDIVYNYYDREIDDLSNLELYNLLCKIYDISFDQYDYLDIITKKYNVKYDRFVEFDTYMTFSCMKSWKEGKSFLYKNALYQVIYVAAVSEDTKLEDDDVLLKNDIKTMVENKKIVIVAEIPVEIEESLDFSEEYEKFPMQNDFNFSNQYIEIEDIDIELLIAILKERISTKKLKRDFKKYIYDLNEDIKETLLFLGNSPILKNLYDSCNELYEKSGSKAYMKKLCNNKH